MRTSILDFLSALETYKKTVENAEHLKDTSSVNAVKELANRCIKTAEDELQSAFDFAVSESITLTNARRHD